MFIHRVIKKTDLINLEDIFFKEGGCGNITEIREYGWQTEKL